jgi:hypothetical protein
MLNCCLVDRMPAQCAIADLVLREQLEGGQDGGSCVIHVEACGVGMMHCIGDCAGIPLGLVAGRLGGCVWQV